MPFGTRAGIAARRAMALLAVLLVHGFSERVGAGELVLKDGTVLRGTLETPAVLRGTSSRP